MSCDFLIGCSGRFPFSAFFDDALSEQFRISTLELCESNYRIVQVPFSGSQRVVAVSGSSSPFRVLVHDIDSRQLLCQCLGHRRPISGLASVSSETLSSNPVIVSGGCGDSDVIIFDALTGSELGELRAPTFTWRLLHLREWNTDLIVGGESGFVALYDLKTRLKRVQFGEQQRGNDVLGLCGSISRNLVIACSRNLRIWSRGGVSFTNPVRLSHFGESCCFVEEKNQVIVGMENGKAEVWDVRQLSAAVRVVNVSPDGKYGPYGIKDLVRGKDDQIVCGTAEGCSQYHKFSRWFGGSVIVFNPESGRVCAKTKLPSPVHGVCALRIRQGMCDGEYGIERWKFGLKTLIEGSVSVVRVQVEGVSPIRVSLWLLQVRDEW